jgi:hypothetical protein
VSGILLFFVALFILFFCYFDKNVKFSFKVLATERERERERERVLCLLSGNLTTLDLILLLFSEL